MSNIFSDPAFAQVQPDSLLEFDCSPTVEDVEFRGLLLNAPEEVRFTPGQVNPLSGAFAPVVVCGAYVFAYDTEGLNGEFLDAIVIVAVDEATRESFSGKLNLDRSVANVPTIAETLGLEPGDFAGRVITGYFNPNLATTVRIPAKPAEYVVYAVLGPYQSNTVKVKVTELGED